MVKNLILWVVVAVVMMTAYQSFNSTSTGSVTDYTTFITDVENSQVRQAKFEDNEILVTKADGSRYTTVIPLEDKKGYIRLEKIRFRRETEDDIVLKGTIIDTEFSGVTVRYTVQVSDHQVVNVTRIDSQFAIKSVGENVELYITPSDIVQY